VELNQGVSFDALESRLKLILEDALGEPDLLLNAAEKGIELLVGLNIEPSNDILGDGRTWRPFEELKLKRFVPFLELGALFVLVLQGIPQIAFELHHLTLKLLSLLHPFLLTSFVKQALDTGRSAVEFLDQKRITALNRVLQFLAPRLHLASHGGVSGERGPVLYLCTSILVLMSIA
jgi:hypothetical protein